VQGLSVLVAVLCIVASLRRLARAAAPLSLNVEELCIALTDVESARRLHSALADALEAEWTRDLFTTFLERDTRVRDALINELLTDLEGHRSAWSRVPRVSARVAASAGFLFATILFLRSLAVADTAPLASAIVPAINAFSIGIAAAAFCIAIHVCAVRADRDSTLAIDGLVRRMESITEVPKASQ
jgi:hypothetical protein